MHGYFTRNDYLHSYRKAKVNWTANGNAEHPKPLGSSLSPVSASPYWKRIWRSTWGSFFTESRKILMQIQRSLLTHYTNYQKCTVLVIMFKLPKSLVLSEKSLCPIIRTTIRTTCLYLPKARCQIRLSFCCIPWAPVTKLLTLKVLLAVLSTFNSFWVARWFINASQNSLLVKDKSVLEK